MGKLAVHLVTYNGMSYIPKLFDSIINQTFQHLQVRILDNGSTDGTAEWFRTFANKLFVQPTVVLQNKNSGFVLGHNALYKMHIEDGIEEEYVALINQDTILEPSYFKILYEHMDKHLTCGSSTGLIFRFDGLGNDSGTVDSGGISIQPQGKVIDIGAGLHLEKQLTASYESWYQVDGVSGALPMYRSRALKSSLKNAMLFNPEFEMYKEDVDLAYLLNTHGWSAHFVSGAIAYHDRTVAVDTHRSDRTEKSRYFSYRNHLYILMNYRWRENGLVWWRVIFYEFGKFLYVVLFEPRLLIGLRDVIRRVYRTKN